MNLFSEYAFVQYEKNKICQLSNARGLKKVPKSCAEYCLIENTFNNEVMEVHDSSMKLPLILKPTIYSDAIIVGGHLDKRVLEIIGFTAKDMTSFMYNLLGSDIVSDIEIENLAF